MILQELFNKDVKFKVIQNKSDYWVVHSTLEDGKLLEFSAVGMKPGWAKHIIWDIRFTINDSYDKPIDGDPGNSIEVFGVVSTIIKAFIKAKKPEHVYMTAKEPNRTKMYFRLMGRLFTGWKIVKFKDSFDGGYVIACVNANTFPIAYGTSVGVSSEHHITPDGGNRFSGYNGQFDDEFKELK